MDIGIIGAGKMGRALAGNLARVGHQVMLSNSRGPDTLSGVVAELGDGVRAGTTREAVAFGEIVFLAIPYFAVEETARDSGPWDGKLVVDLTNYYAGRDGKELDPGDESSSVIVASHLPGARVVKAFNTILWSLLKDEARPPGPDQLAIVVAGDDEDAVRTVEGLIREIGFIPVRTGSLRDGRRQEPGAAVYTTRPLTAAEAEALLGA